MAPYLGSTVESLPDLLSKFAELPYALMQPPQLWKIHPLIVQDPFMYTHVSGFAARCRIEALNCLYRIMQSLSPFGLSTRLRTIPRLQSER